MKFDERPKVMIARELWTSSDFLAMEIKKKSSVVRRVSFGISVVESQQYF